MRRKDRFFLGTKVQRDKVTKVFELKNNYKASVCILCKEYCIFATLILELDCGSDPSELYFVNQQSKIYNQKS